MGERTRRAYGVDLAQLADWATRAGPRRRRYWATASCAASPACCRSAAPRAPRSDASWPPFAPSTATWSSAGALEANPGDLVASPRRDSYLPRVLRSGEVAELLERVPVIGPLDVRDRALLRAGLLGRPAGAGARGPGRGLDRPGRRGGAGGGQGRKDAGDPGRRARVAGARALPRARAAGPGRGRRRASERCSCRRPAAGSQPRTCAAGWGSRHAARRSRAGCRRTRSGTRSPRTCWREAPTSGPSRSCWATHP